MLSANFVLAGQIGELRTEMAEIKGGDITLTGIYHSGYVSNGNEAGTGIGYWASLSGWSSYIFNVTELAGQSIKVTGAYRAQSYRYIFCRDKDSLPASEDKYNEDPTKWTDNIISVNTGHGSSGNNKYTNTSLKVPSIPDDAEHIYLILAQYSDYKASASYTKESAYQEKLTFDTAPTEGSENPVTSGGVKEALTPIEGNVEALQERLVDYDGSLEPILTKNSALVCNGSSNEPSYWGYGSESVVSHIYDVTQKVGESINIEAYRRANGRPYCFVSDYLSITTSKPTTEEWSEIYIAGTRSNPNTTSNEMVSYARSIPSPKVDGGSVYLIVSGSNAKQIAPKAIIPSDAKIAIPKKTSQLENDAGFVTRSEVETTIFEKEWQQTEKDRIMGYLQKYLGKESFIVGFNTDQHIRQSSRATYTEPALRGLKVLKSMSTDVPFSLICLGGDAAGYSTETTQEKVDADVLEVIEAVDSHHCPVVFITGNHDAGQNLNNSTYGDADGYSMFNTAIKRNVVRRQLDGFNNRSTNCWFDDKANKIRFVFTDCFARANGPTGNNLHVHSAMRANWEDALADEKLYNDGGWGVVIFSHCAMSTDFMTSGINNSQWDDYIKPKIDNGLNILACINGHSHLDSQKALDNVLQICSQQAGIQESNTSFDGIAYTHTDNTVKETSFDVFVFDIAAKSIHAFKYGAGMDREFYYGHDNPRIKLCKLSGVVTTNGGVAAVGTIKATHHNTEYTCTLDSEGRYSFSFLCPERTWTLSIGDYSEDYDAVEGEFVKDVVLA